MSKDERIENLEEYVNYLAETLDHLISYTEYVMEGTPKDELKIKRDYDSWEKQQSRIKKLESL